MYINWYLIYEILFILLRNWRERDQQQISNHSEIRQA